MRFIHPVFFGFGLLLAQSFGCIVENVCAQGRDSRTFFGKDFAAKPGDLQLDRKSDVFERRAPQAVPAQSTPSKPSDGFTELEANDSQPESGTSVPNDPQLNAQVRGDPVAPLALGGVFNGLDIPHLKEQLEFLIELSKKRTIYFNHLYVLGQHEELFNLVKLLSDDYKDPLIFVELMRVIKLTPRIPDIFNVSRSPTWIVTTDKGIFVLEGVVSPSRYFTNDGLFLAPGFSVEATEKPS